MADETYTNPVYDGSFPDPFVLRHRGEYWGYATGVAADGRCFPILRSRDLVTWTEVGGAMEPLPDAHPHYWAPEVTYDNGRFYCYYSAGDEVNMHLRVAVAERPEGPFVDSGRQLTAEQFAIDAHVFVDDDGSRYMFYATDFLEHTHIGTGTVVDRMLDPYTLEGKPRPVTRARFDWQVYDPARAEKGGVRWHTVEGPFVLEHKGLYYEMFSGGNWQNVSYGVSYATSRAVLADGEWHQTCDGADVLPILRTIPERVVGPGHNSVVLGPDGRQFYCVYHRWTSTGRALAIDRLEWIGERLAVLGPTDDPTPAPILPAIVRDAPDASEIDVGSSAFAVECDVRGPVGVTLLAGRDAVLDLSLEASDRAAKIRWIADDRVTRITLDRAFDDDALHTLRLDVDNTTVRVALDGVRLARGTVGDAPTRVALRDGGSGTCAALSISRGRTDDFAEDGSPAIHGWAGDGNAWRVEGGELRTNGVATGELTKPVEVDDYELVVNARCERGSFTIAPARDRDGDGPIFELRRDGDACSLATQHEAFTLDASFDPTAYQQFRFRKHGSLVEVAREGERLGVVDAPLAATSIAIGAREGNVAFDLVRLSELPKAPRGDD